MFLNLQNINVFCISNTFDNGTKTELAYGTINYEKSTIICETPYSKETDITEIMLNRFRIEHSK